MVRVWHVLDEPSLFDHNYILSQLGEGIPDALNYSNLTKTDWTSYAGIYWIDLGDQPGFPVLT